MSLLEQINKEDIKKVISYSQGIENPKIDELLDNWDKNKHRISHKFLKDNILYTHPEKVRFELSPDSQLDRFNHYIDYLFNIFYNEHNPLCDFLCAVGYEAFYNNTLATDYIIIEKENKKIPKGSKVIKAFKYFVENEDLLHDLQNKASEIIQENKVEGYLTFSIHPLDFLSSSENQYNWRSCHSLDGEYRAGNLSYIGDRSTMIVYLASDKQEWLPHFPEDVPWNSKKWRLLLHFDDNLEVCFAGRQYPFFSPGALDTIKSVFDNILAPVTDNFYLPWDEPKREKWSGWYNDYIENFLRSNGETEDIDEGNYCVINKGIFDIRKIVKDAEHSRHFNDVLRSSCYLKPYYMFKKYWSPQANINIEVGSEAKCLCCGEHYINGGDTMMCSDCECEFGDSDSDEYRTCDSCGGRHYYEEGEWIGDEWLCDSCIDIETFRCECCGERAYNSEKHWDDDNGRYICDYCLNERIEA